jgi:hypothetical protein
MATIFGVAILFLMTGLPAFPTTLSGLLTFLVGLLVLWVVVSIPVYFAGKMINKGNAHLGQAMGATLGGIVVYFIVLYGVAFLLGTLLGPPAAILGSILAVVAWLAVYRASFATSWIRALGIVVVAWLILLVLDFLLVALLGISIPKFFPF